MTSVRLAESAATRATVQPWVEARGELPGRPQHQAGDLQSAGRHRPAAPRRQLPRLQGAHPRRPADRQGAVARPPGLHPDTPRHAGARLLRRGGDPHGIQRRGRGVDQARDRRGQGGRVRPHRAHRRPCGRARAAHAGAFRAQRLHREVGPAARARPAAARRGRGAAEEALRRVQCVAQHRPRSGRDGAAGFRRCREHRAARPRGLRPGLCRPHRRDLSGRLQRRSPLVLLPAR